MAAALGLEPRPDTFRGWRPALDDAARNGDGKHVCSFEAVAVCRSIWHRSSQAPVRARASKWWRGRESNAHQRAPKARGLPLPYLSEWGDRTVLRRRLKGHNLALCC